MNPRMHLSIHPATHPSIHLTNTMSTHSVEALCWVQDDIVVTKIDTVPAFKRLTVW